MRRKSGIDVSPVLYNFSTENDQTISMQLATTTAHTATFRYRFTASITITTA